MTRLTMLAILPSKPRDMEIVVKENVGRTTDASNTTPPAHFS
jgi:hypothetical protein